MTYRHTLYASYLGYVTQAICNNLPPLLFVTFNERFGVSLGSWGCWCPSTSPSRCWWTCSPPAMWTASATARAVVLAQALSTLGLLLLGVLPYVLANAFVAILIPSPSARWGGGLLEVLVSPIVESLPGEHKKRP